MNHLQPDLSGQERTRTLFLPCVNYFSWEEYPSPQVLRNQRGGKTGGPPGFDEPVILP